MPRMNQLLLTSGVALALFISADVIPAQDNPGGGRTNRGNAQGGGRQGRDNFDPAQFQQRMMERCKETLEITDDTEWKAIQPLVQKVLDSRMAMGSRGGGPRGNRPGRDRNQTDQNQRRPSTPSNPAAEALRKAIDAKAPPPEMKAALAKYSEARKTQQADLEKAQADLRSVLTARQEALAALSGLL